MMAIFGWVVCLLILVCVSIATLFGAFNTLGMYNIGGVPNTVKDKLLTLMIIAIIVFLYVVLFQNAPFSMTLK